MRTQVHAWLWQHSLSIALTFGFVVTSFVSYLFAAESRQFWYDFFMNIGGGFGTAAVIIVGSRYLWEKDSEPAKPPHD